MTAFKKPGPALGSLSGAVSPAGGSGLPEIGDRLEGGYFCGTINNGGTPYGLIVAPAAVGEATGLQWKTTQTATSGTSSRTDGAANTAAEDNASHPAGQYCAGLTIGGRSDWYLPAIDELLQISAFNSHLPAAASLAPAPAYWASTENSSTAAKALSTAGAETNLLKDATIVYTRAVRRVAL